MPGFSTRLEYLYDRFVHDTGTSEEIAEFWALLRQAGEDDALRQAVYNQYSDKIPKENPVDWQPAQKWILQKRLPAIRYPRWRWWAAASIVLLLCAGGYFFIHRAAPGGQVAHRNIQPADIAPGHNGAMLTLADGTTVLLDSAGNGQVARQGDVQILNKDGQLIYGNGKEVVYNTLSTPAGRQYNIVLPDGSRVWLNAASSIHYPTAFTGRERKVAVTGEAYFEVAKDHAHPFIVKALNAEVTVLGTHFNVMAYPDEGSVKTTLLEGSVKVAGGGKTVKILPGQQASVAPKGILISKADTSQAVAWVKGELSLENVDIAALMRQVARWYDVDVELHGTMPEKHFFGMIDRNTAYLSQILSVLRENGLQVKTAGRKIIITAN